jgi:ABC-type phosphate transport system substrate-binding protein
MKTLVVLVLISVWSSAIAEDVIFWKIHNGYIEIERQYIEKIFTKKIAKWPDGNNIDVYIKPIHSIEHRNFVKNVLGVSTFYYQQQLETQTYTGRAPSVIEVSDDSQMMLNVEKNSKAIGYLNYEVYVDNKKIRVVPDTIIK